MGGIITKPRPLIKPGIDNDIEIDIKDELDEDGEKRFAHLIIGGEDAILAARINGTFVIAICGKRFKPSRDPKQYPPCPDCKEIEKQLPNNSNPNEGDDDYHLPRRLK